MKEYKYLYRQMLDEKLIRKAYKRLRKGKTKRKEIQRIDKNLDLEVKVMQLIIWNTRPCEVDAPGAAFKPQWHKPKTIHEHGKTRKIYMPEIHEQWMHHIIVLVLEPIVLATAYPYSCGSFPKRGAHYAKKRMEKIIRSGKGIKYFAKCDIRHFYNNIDVDILFRELKIRIKDDWFLYILRLCLKDFRRGIPLGFYISQWLANYMLEPLDKFITETLGFKSLIRYMDDSSIFCDNKKDLHRAVIEIQKFIGRRFHLRLKSNWQVCRFNYQRKDGKVIGRPLDYMGFVFFRNRTTIRKSIMLKAVRQAKLLNKEMNAKGLYLKKHIQAMLSYMGWFSWTNSYNCFQDYVAPNVNTKKLKNIISKLDKRRNDRDQLDGREVCVAA